MAFALKGPTLTLRHTDPIEIGFVVGWTNPAAIPNPLRQAVRMLQQAPENSDRARLTKEVGWMWDSREGYGTNLTFGAIKINN